MVHCSRESHSRRDPWAAKMFRGYKSNEPQVLNPGLMLASRDFCGRLTLRELEALAGAGLTVLLALLHSGVACEKALFPQDGLQIGRSLQQRPCNAVTDRACLARHAAAIDADEHIKFPRVLSRFERLQRDGSL